MKLYIAKATCSLAVQTVLNELGVDVGLVHYDVFGKSLSDGGSFDLINELGYVPVLELDTPNKDRLTETATIVSYLADTYGNGTIAPARGTLERVRVEQLLAFTGTELAQKHIPLMRKLLTEEGTAWTRAKLVKAYGLLDTLLSDGRAYITGEHFTIADAYIWGTMWHERSGAEIGHLEHLMAYKARVEARPSVQKAWRDEAEAVEAHLGAEAA
jgi:glutathione S-transferase